MKKWTFNGAGQLQKDGNNTHVFLDTPRERAALLAILDEYKHTLDIERNANEAQQRIITKLQDKQLGYETLATLSTSRNKELDAKIELAIRYAEYMIAHVANDIDAGNSAHWHAGDVIHVLEMARDVLAGKPVPFDDTFFDEQDASDDLPAYVRIAWDGTRHSSGAYPVLNERTIGSHSFYQIVTRTGTHYVKATKCLPVSDNDVSKVA